MPVGPGMQHRAAVAQAGDAAAVEQMGIDARDLRRGVGAQAEGAAGQLVDELEGLQIERMAGAGKQRLEVLQQWRDHELEAVAARHVEQPAAQFFDVSGLRRQDIGDVLWQQPSRGHVKAAAG